MLAPAHGFYFTPSLGKNQARIAYILNSDRLGRALHILGEAVGEYQKKKFQHAQL
jgi:aspartate aminotransferase